MQRTIFNSWESDLPNNANWTFIENCIKRSTKELIELQPISINLTLDRATREESGSPDITESIFSKISNSSVFIADISIINCSKDNSRKVPNPNVLIELGYAARTLGWEKIICIYNTDFGSFDDLPFDLRNRRIMAYSLKGKRKTEAKKDLVNRIKKSIIEMQSKGILTDKILDFLKKEIDQEMLGLISHLIRFINKKDEKINFFEEINTFLKYEKNDLLTILKNKKTIGFYIFKSFHEYEQKFNDFVNQAMGSQYYNREILNSLIDIYEWFSAYSNMWTKYSSDLFTKLDKKEDRLFVIHSSEVSPEGKLDKRYLLMEKVEKDQGRVHNFGDFFPGHVPNLINYYKFNDKYLDKYVDIILLLIKSFNQWLELTNNEIIMDFMKSFRMRKKNGEWI